MGSYDNSYMMLSFKKKEKVNKRRYLIILVSLLCLAPLIAAAQDEEDFSKLARRSIDSYEKKLEKEQAGYDSAVWHGAAYVGTSSRGHILPNGFFNYRKGKVQMKGDIEMDFSNLNTSRTEEANHDNGAYQYTSTKIANRYEHENLTFRLDYHLDKQNILAFDFFQKYRSDHVGETANLYKESKEGADGNTYEDQHRKQKDFNCGSLVEYLHNFTPGGSFSARAYIKYDNTPTDITSEVWGKELVYKESFDHRSHRSTDKKGQLIYLSPKWSGFSFGLREKVGFTNTQINDEISTFGYDVTQTLSSGDLKYALGNFSFVAQGGLETYHHKVKTHSGDNKGEINHIYRDFIYDITATWKMNAHNTLKLSYGHSIDRPTYTQLYPFVHVGSNIGSRVKGNENLQPAITNKIQGKYTYSVPTFDISTTLTYQKKSDDITSIATYDEVEQLNVKTWINDAEYNTLRTAIEGEVTSGNFNMTFGARVQRLWYDGENVSEDKAWSYSFKVRPAILLPNEWKLSAVALYNGREEHLHYYNEAYTYLALRAQKQLGDWAVYAFMQDLLNESHVKSQYSKGNSILTTNNYNTRALIIGCSYRF